MLYAFLSISIILGLICWCYLRHKHHAPMLHHNENELIHHILKNKPRFTSPYRMPFWLQNTHVHSLFYIAMQFKKVHFDREFVTMTDGGVVALDWVMDNTHELTDTSPVLIVLLTWTAHREDSMGLCKEALQRGFRAVVFNKRGHGNLSLHTPKLQYFGDSSDFRQCVEYIHDRYPRAHLFGHGSSAGNGSLISYVTKSREKCLLTACVFVSPSYNVERTFNDMSCIYRHFLLLYLKLLVWKHRHVLKSAVDIKSTLLSLTFRDIDHRLYSRCYGYDDVDDLRRDHDPLDNVHTVTTPIMSISSHDDPVCKTNTIPYHVFRDDNYPARLLVTVPNGGHCGFFENGFKLESWSNQLSLDYLEGVIEYIGEKE